MDARVHTGADAPIVRLRWVYTDQPFLPVGTGCVINNRVWNEDFYSDLPVGQLQAVIANYEQDARWALPPGFKSDHICNPQWLATGEPWPNDLPPQEYTTGNMPVCCGWVDNSPRGGVVVGGEAGDVLSGYDPTAGGVAVGGRSGDAHYPPDPTAGGVAIGGQSGDVPSGSDPTEGGVEVGGEAGDVYLPPDPTEGGVEVGGEAGDGYGPPVHGEMIYDLAGAFTFVAETSAPHVVECWGPGGDGIGMIADEEVKCSGGGGGAYSARTVTLFLGVGYAVVNQSGGSELPTTFEAGVSGLQVVAAPGENADGDAGGSGGQVADCIGDVMFKGGDGVGGGTAPRGGGSGGGGAGSLMDGVNGNIGTDPSGGVGGLGGSLNGGDGGDGGDVGSDGFNGQHAGGGGGGGGTGTTSGGFGNRGRVRIVW